MTAPTQPDHKDRRPPPAGGTAEERAERLKAALKANIARRKAQARARAEGAADAGDGADNDGKGRSG